MSEPTAVSVILEPIGLIFSGLASIHWSWWASRVASLLALPWKLLLAPIRLIVRVVLVVLAPVILVLGYILAGLRAVLNFLASLEPLYTFFGAAAFVGIIAGLIIGISSTYITTYLGMQDEPSEDDVLYGSSSSSALKQRQRRYLNDTDDLDSVKDDSSASTEFDMQWLEPSSSPSRRRLVSGLLSQTIHEEDDDESDAAL